MHDFLRILPTWRAGEHTRALPAALAVFVCANKASAAVVEVISASRRVCLDESSTAIDKVAAPDARKQRADGMLRRARA